MEPKVSVFFLIIGLVGAFYKGIMAVAILNESYRVLIKLIQNSIIDMIPFTVILIAQILLFASLNSVNKMQEKFSGNENYQNQDNIFLNSFLDYYMIMFGDLPKRTSLDKIQYFLLLSFAFLVNIVNLNLLISIIGDTFEKVQSNQLAMNYKMKANALTEVGGLQKWERHLDEE